MRREGVLFFQNPGNVLTGPRPNKRVGKSADFLPNFATEELKILSHKKKNYRLQFSNGIILKTSNQETQFAAFTLRFRRARKHCPQDVCAESFAAVQFERSTSSAMCSLLRVEACLGPTIISIY